MLNENAKKWVAALRSGRYPQGRHSLNQNDRAFCCLGVGCEVAIESGVDVKKTHSGFGQAVKYNNSMSVLPLIVLQWLGLASASGHFTDSRFSSLVALNDNGQHTFNDIADIIESEPEGLFRGTQKENPPDKQADKTYL
jgi:hypothetical protein